MFLVKKVEIELNMPYLKLSTQEFGHEHMHSREKNSSHSVFSQLFNIERLQPKQL